MKIGNRIIGEGQPALIVAEVGVNHNGDVNRALEMVRAAAKAGCEAIKVQAFTVDGPDGFVGPDETYDYLERDVTNDIGGIPAYRRVKARQVDMFNDSALTLDELLQVAAECKRLGLLFGATATDQGWIDALLPHVQFFKVGSDDLTNLPLLRAMQATGKPVILSTGMATAREVTDALAVWPWPFPADVAILHCVSLYPTPLSKANLRRMKSFTGAQCYGYSDHTQGLTAASLAIGFGAAIIEKHFTLDQSLPGPDHYFSATPQELESLCAWAKAAHAILGTGEIDPSPAEMEMRKLARRSIVAARDIDQGQVITAADLAYKRPGTGLPPSMAPSVIGRAAEKAIRAGEQLSIYAIGGFVEKDYKVALHSGETVIPAHRWPIVNSSSSGYKH